MTVAQLKKKLDKFPDTAEVIVSNDYMFVEGMYKATSVEEYDGFVLIDSDHKRRLEE